MDSEFGDNRAMRRFETGAHIQADIRVSTSTEDIEFGGEFFEDTPGDALGLGGARQDFDGNRRPAPRGAPDLTESAAANDFG